MQRIIDFFPRATKQPYSQFLDNDPLSQLLKILEQILVVLRLVLNLVYLTFIHTAQVFAY